MTAALGYPRSFPVPPTLDSTTPAMRLATNSCRCSGGRPLRQALLPARARLSCGERQAVAVLLRPGRSGPRKHLVRRSAGTGPTPGSSWTPTRAMARGMASTTSSASRQSPLHTLAYDVADDLKVRRAEAGAEQDAEAPGAATPGRRPLEATSGFDARYIDLAGRGPPSLRRRLLRPRPGGEPGAAEGSSPRTEHPAKARSPISSAAHRRLLADARPARRRPPHDAARQRRVRLRLRLKIGARVVAARIRIHFRPDAALPPARRAPRSALMAPCPANPSPFNSPPKLARCPTASAGKAAPF